jgi:hypothetical protein
MRPISTAGHRPNVRRGLTVLAAVVLLSGCSSTPAPEPDPTATGAGQASGDLVAWAGAVCAIQQMTWDLDATVPPVPTTAADIASYATGLRDYAAHFATLYGDAADAATSLDPAPVDGGDQVTLQVQESFQAGADNYADVVSLADAFDPDGSDALTRAASLQAALDDAYRQTSQSFQDAIGTGKAMSDAFRTAPECVAS